MAMFLARNQLYDWSTNRTGCWGKQNTLSSHLVCGSVPVDVSLDLAEIMRGEILDLLHISPVL